MVAIWLLFGFIFGLWASVDAAQRGKSGILVFLMLITLSPVGLIIWLIFRDKTNTNDSNGTVKGRYMRKVLMVALVIVLLMSNFFFVNRSIKFERVYKASARWEINNIMSNINQVEPILSKGLVDLDFNKGYGLENMTTIVRLLNDIRLSYHRYESFYLTNKERRNNTGNFYSNLIFIEEGLSIYSGIAYSYCKRADFTNDINLKTLLKELKEFMVVLNVRDSIMDQKDSDSEAIKSFNSRNGNNEKLKEFLKNSELLPVFNVE
ncbi:hypothetical protein [Clostridium sp.]|uniref:hypothetical protein n=1 Tax=Clostridium sp. TaxID=1506 RepID=UPI002FC8D831